MGNRIFYGETKYINRIEFSKIIDKEKLKQEWDLVKYYLWSYKNNNEEMDFIQLWKHILDTDEDFSFNYPTHQENGYKYNAYIMRNCRD